ncbi:MAG: PD-(D/E)XK nuclease family protein [Oscillospiraceae bacterium]
MKKGCFYRFVQGLYRSAVCADRQSFISGGQPDCGAYRCARNRGEFGIFSNIRAAAEKIRYAAARYRISEEEPLVFRQADFRFGEYCGGGKAYFGRHTRKTENDGSLTVCAADTAAEEAEFAVRNIRRLVRTENYRYRDFVIIARDAERYDDFINAACETYGIPCFSDKRCPLSAFPLAALADAAIQAILKGDSESILRFHKTGLGTLNTAEISELENYVTLWNIEGDMWRHEWMMDVRGFVSDDTEPDEKALGEINKLAKKGNSPLEKLRAEFGGTAEDMAAALVRLFEECGAAEKLSVMSQKFLNDSEEFSSDVLRQSYDRYMKLLDGIAACFGTREVGKQEFREVLSLAVSFETVGSVPRYLDEVTFGAADRIRPSRPKVAFILGANQGVFPKEISASGIFGISDRKSLIALGVDIPDKSVSAATDENYLVYCNLCCPSDKLFISYARRSLTGENMEPSAFVQEITENIAHGFVAEPEEKITDENLPETAASAYSELCRRRNAENGGAAEIRAALADTKELKKAEYTEKRLSGAPAAIGKETARQLFGEEIKMSASRLDTFNRCRFSFFCRYGLSVKKLQPAEFDVLQRGTVVHYCLERFVKEYGKGVSVLSPEKIEELTDGYINDYLDGVTGYRAVETARGRFLVSRISRSVKEVAKRLAEEFAQSGFEPIACELKIGGEGENLEFPYDGGKISVSGSIDRVDKFGGYIRVVDYKTGSKSLNYPIFFSGLICKCFCTFTPRCGERAAR